MSTNTTNSLFKEFNLHTKFALTCTPYYLRHGIEIFSDYSLPLDVTVLIWKLKKDTKCHQFSFLKFHIQTGSAQQSLNVYRQKMDESRTIEFGLSFLDKIKCSQQFKHVLLINFKNLEKCDILKNVLKNLP